MAGPAGVAAPRPTIRGEELYLAPRTEGNVMAEVLALHGALIASQHLRWMGECQCQLAENPEAWQATTVSSSRLARKVCARCPVAQACFNYAMAHPDVRGVWGGTTQRDRTAAHRHHDQARKAARDRSTDRPA